MPCYIVYTFIIVFVLQIVHASWWYLGMTSSYQTLLEELQEVPVRKRCANLQFLAPKQQKLCDQEEKLIDVIHEGANVGIEECQFQFKDRRWNCSTFNTTNVFGQVLSTKSRETAYIYAISSAGVMYSVTRACARGQLDQCGCDTKTRQLVTDGNFEWGGCSDNIRYGQRFSKEFVDSNEMKRNDFGLMNVWNNGAGRKTIKDNMEFICKCHGVSGSCSVKICWRKMKAFRKIGSALKARFDGASIVRVDRNRLKLKRLNKNQKRPTKRDLVYLEESPDFCNFNPASGSLGTRGRKCNKTSIAVDGCSLMCCGRGYYTLVKEERDDCDCKFYWCCRVVCKKCTRTVEMHYCN
ncbi:protein Wnt-4-like [Haliotis asinina]|uniref:protein Wnt-4-like n=1 Tax=Haliotis asinina TaxID=109174 RepID=UPI00353188F2